MKASTRPAGAAHELARGRKFSSQELRRLLLALFDGEPRHGYQLMQQIATRSNGCYAPSAGMVYPALAHLEADGYIETVAFGKRKSYRLTDAGRRQVAATRADVDILWAKLDFLGQKMVLARRAFADEDARLERDQQGSQQAVTAAFEALKLAVSAVDKGSPAAQRNLVGVLERASQEIVAIK